MLPHVLLYILASALAVSACGTPIMRDTTTLQKPEKEHALVTFLRPTNDGGAIKFGLWDSDTFIGLLNAKKIVQYKATPGEHLFLARAENWSYCKATLEAGKHYYIFGKVFPGEWKAQVGLSPVVKSPKTTQKQIDQWVKKGTPSEVIPLELEAYQNPRQAQVREAIGEYESGLVKFEVLKTTDSWE